MRVLGEMTGEIAPKKTEEAEYDFSVLCVPFFSEPSVLPYIAGFYKYLYLTLAFKA